MKKTKDPGDTQEEEDNQEGSGSLVDLKTKRAGFWSGSF